MLDPVHYDNISLVGHAVSFVMKHRKEEDHENADMLATLGILVGLEILAKDVFYNRRFKPKGRGTKDEFIRATDFIGGHFFKLGLKLLVPLTKGQVEGLWRLRCHLAHAFNLPRDPEKYGVFELNPGFGPGLNEWSSDNDHITASIVKGPPKTTVYVRSLARLLGEANRIVVQASFEDGWETLYEQLVVYRT